MTLEEAIKQLEFDRAMILFNATTGEEITPEILKLISGDNYRTYVADGAAIEALKEIQQYRAIGTVEDFVNLKRGAAIMSDLYKFGYTLDETIETMRDVIDTGNHDRMFLDTYYWLKMLSEYRKNGTVEECREAVEKQKPKMPDYEGDGYADEEMVYDTWICPNCGKKYEVDYDDYKHCPNCGQAIDENLEETKDE